MSRGFSLDGARFAFHCVPAPERLELASLLLRNNGSLYGTADARRPGVVHVITSYWADCLPRPAPGGVLLRPVTKFWLQETLRLGRWLRPDSHPFFEPPNRPSDLRLQYPAGFQDGWQLQDEVDGDGDVNMQDPAGRKAGHRMKLPCSPNCLFRGQVPLWPYFAAFLAQPIHNAQELAARLQLMALSDPRRRFNCLEYALNELLTREEQVKFFKDVLPEMVRLVLAMPQMFAAPPPLLTPLEDGEDLDGEQAEIGADAGRRARVVTQSHRFTKLEVLTLVCGCFFAIFPEQDIVKNTQADLSPQSKKAGRRVDDDDMIQFPFFTAFRMFSAPGNGSRMVVLKGQKIRCILQYFLRVVPRAISDRAALSTEVVDFTRVGVQIPQGRVHTEQTTQDLLGILVAATDNPVTTHEASSDVGALHPRLFPARCVSDTLIEDLDKHLQIDFANKFAGGGVLNSGCVQEEIRFMLSPELLVSCLMFAKLEPHEAFVIHGSERYSAYQGYGGSFVYGGNFDDMTQLVSLPDGRVRRECVIVGIDATDYSSARVERQYTRGHVCRDLVKSYAGFAYPDAHDGERCWPVATGNWGCGVFQGDRELKFLIQWLAASLRRRELVYVLFERDLDLQTKVNPLLTLATCPKAREWDRQSAGLTQWLMGFLFDELSVGRGGTRDQGVLNRASLSLERALAALNLSDENRQEPETQKPQQPEGSPQASPISTESKEKSLAVLPGREEQADKSSEGLKKKAKTTKDLHQKTMQDFFSPK